MKTSNKLKGKGGKDRAKIKAKDIAAAIKALRKKDKQK